MIRVNPKVIFGLSQAQLIGLAIILVGIIFYSLNLQKEKSLKHQINI